MLDDEEEVIKRGLDLIERGLEHLTKEKITSTGVQGLGMDYATPDESPRGPTQISAITPCRTLTLKREPMMS